MDLESAFDTPERYVLQKIMEKHKLEEKTDANKKNSARETRVNEVIGSIFWAQDFGRDAR